MSSNPTAARIRWPAEEAFDGHGIPEMCRRYGARAINLTSYPREKVETEIAGRRRRVELSKLLTRETDVFITMPVPKLHMMTGVSLGFKNQWGCLPDVKRLRNHCGFRAQGSRDQQDPQASIGDFRRDLFPQPKRTARGRSDSYGSADRVTRCWRGLVGVLRTDGNRAQISAAPASRNRRGDDAAYD